MKPAGSSPAASAHGPGAPAGRRFDMRKTLKILLLVALVTLSTWAAVLWHWDRTKRDMSVNDIVIYLFALPAVVIALGFWLRWVWQAAVGSVQTDADDASRHAAIKLLSAHVCPPTGQTPADMLAVAKEGKPWPSPFDELRSNDGMPVMYTGAASPLIAVAAAAEEARGTDQPVIALTPRDAFVRMAMVVRTLPTPLETTSSS